jgi:hypothetical protein
MTGYLKDHGLGSQREFPDARYAETADPIFGDSLR